jgi:cytochrome c556
VVFTPSHAPSGVAPFALVGDDVYCVIDPEAPEPANLEAAIRLARLLALASLVEHEAEVDAAAVRAALTAIREQLDVVRSLKGQLTSISNATKAVWSGLDQMRSNILARVTEAEAEIGS